MKVFLCVLFIILIATQLFSELNVSVDYNRFFDENMNTVLDLNYEIPYKELQFVKTDYGFLAELEVRFIIKQDTTVAYDQSFTNRIILTNEEKTISEGSFLDKIFATLSISGLDISLIFTDKIQEESKNWSYVFETLDKTNLVSDLEFSAEITADTTSYLDKFHRGDYLHLVKPSHIFELREDSRIFIYYELQNFALNQQMESDLNIELILERNDLVAKSVSKNLKHGQIWIPDVIELETGDLEPGYYLVKFVVKDNLTNQVQQVDDFLSLKKKTQYLIRMFPDLEDEYRLIRYFLTSSQTAIWKDLEDTGKRNFVDRFWSNNDPDLVTEDNEFYLIIKDRVEYSNLSFSHFQPGWESDRGRIYIRQGSPDEVKKLTTGINTRLGEKDYEIWKYRGKKNLTYIFIDFQTSGNFQLIYNENDPRETSLPDWGRYMGEDFDESLLN